MNVYANPICRNVNINLFAEYKSYIKRKHSLCNRKNNVGNGNYNLICMK